MFSYSLFPALLLSLLAASLGFPGLSAQTQFGTLRLERVASGLTRPVFLTHAGLGTALLYVVEQRDGTTGRIRLLNSFTGELLPEPFLEVPNVRTGNEEGLLGLALDPGYSFNGRFFVYYVTTDAVANPVAPHAVSVLERYQVSSDPRFADPATAQRILVLPQPYSNHNGGWIAFGPDGFLYVSTGDGGSSNDPLNASQSLVDNPSTLNANEGLLGKLLRLDVSGADAFPGDPLRHYAIPSSNPFAAGGGAPEIWAYGLRNAWRASFDRLEGDLWIADVGQSNREEINFAPADDPGGRNYGWRPLEGTADNTAVPDPAPENAVAPIFEYAHSLGRSVTGGYVYRGSDIPWLFGHYLYADFVRGWVRGFRLGSEGVVDERNWTPELTASLPAGQSIGNPASFGEGPTGELYLIDLGGQIFRFTQANYSRWRNLNFTVEEITAGTISAPTADPDGDGMSNAAEFVGGGLARTPNTASRPYPEVVKVDGVDYLSLVWEVDPDVFGAYSITATPSADLEDFAPEPLPVMEASASRYQVRDHVPISDSGGRWIRLEVQVAE